MIRTAHTFFEFFAGGGMARVGLGDAWRCGFANDVDAMKVATYVENFGAGDITRADVAQLTLADLPAFAPDLVWASFPCQDLSLAGDYRGLGGERDDAPTRSGTFWPFWKLMRALIADGRAPHLVVLENVYGVLTSRNGEDFAAIAAALSQEKYRFGAIVLDAADFVPQSRPRVFFIAARADASLPDAVVSDGPCDRLHPATLVEANARLREREKSNWIWWRLPRPALRNSRLADIIEQDPAGVAWRTPAETKALLDMMSPINRAKVAQARKAGALMVGAVYKRTRFDESGAKVQRAEVRFDDVAGCLRTPAGGSSRQTILVVDGKSARSRLLSPREAARLMGLPDQYKLPARYNDAYRVCGDGVCAPVVSHIARHILEPALEPALAKKIASEQIAAA
ncbi:MAG: DNA cytosine methyltransferase [Hyphomicrobiales bacterium]|nr:DNA cytosine methyltransferase [Hyphomicrobiales bacterium]